MLSRLNDFVVCSTSLLFGGVGANLIIFREKVLDLGPKSVCAVEMKMYVFA